MFEKLLEDSRVANKGLAPRSLSQGLIIFLNIFLYNIFIIILLFPHKIKKYNKYVRIGMFHQGASLVRTT